MMGTQTREFIGGASSRRTFLLGGLAAISAPFLAGALLTGSGSQTGDTNAANKQDSHLVSALSWQGLDFAWLPGGAQLACVTQQGLFLVDWRQQIWRQQVSGDAVTQVLSWSADGRRLACLTSTALLVYDIVTGRRLWSYQGVRPSAHTVSLSPDGMLLAQATPASADGTPTVKIWQMQDARLVAQYAQGNEKQAASMIWSPDSTRIASTDRDGSIHVWKVASGQLFRAYKAQAASGPREALGWSPDGAALAFSASGEKGQTLLGVADANNGQTRFQLPASMSGPLSSVQRTREIAWSPDGTSLAFEAQDRNGVFVSVCAVQSGHQIFACQRVSGQPANIVWSPDGRYLAASITRVNPGELAGGDNGDRSVVQFWDARTGSALFAYSAPKDPDHLRWSSDSRYLALITPRLYGELPNKTCLSLCRFGYEDYALEVFRVG